MTDVATGGTRVTIAKRESVRVLFAIGVLPPFYEADDDEVRGLFDTLIEVYADLGGRYGATVLGTFDDYLLSVGPSRSWPWTSYLLADLPDVDTAIALCNLVRTTRHPNGHKLWHYLRVEARIGTRLFFGNE